MTDYRGEHTAPGDDSIPLHDLTRNMPKDVYETLHEYIRPGVTYSVIMSKRGHPNRPVRVYRAVPHTPTPAEQIALYQKHQRYILKTGRVPPGADWSGTNSSTYFDFLDRQIAKLSKQQPEPAERLRIQPGDWVTLDRAYAVEHGRSNLRNQYRILSKVVRAGELFTDGDLEEWGWSP